jgi:hypothetical protein
VTEWLATFDNGAMLRVKALSELDAQVKVQRWRTRTGRNVAAGYGIHDLTELYWTTEKHQPEGSA